MLRLGPVRNGHLRNQGWFHVSCSTENHLDTVHYLYKPYWSPGIWFDNFSSTNMPSPCRGGQIGDRLLSFTTYGAGSVTVLGLQSKNGTLAGYQFPFHVGTACARYSTNVLYAGRYTHALPNTVDGIFDYKTAHLRYMTRVVRVGAFAGMLITVSLLAMLIRSGAPPCMATLRESLRSLSCCGLVGFALFTTIWLWSIPLYMWIFPKPVFGMQVLGVGCFSFYVARSLLSCGQQTALARAAAAAAAADRAALEEGYDLDGHRSESAQSRGRGTASSRSSSSDSNKRRGSSNPSPAMVHSTEMGGTVIVGRGLRTTPTKERSTAPSGLGQEGGRGGGEGGGVVGKELL